MVDKTETKTEAEDATDPNAQIYEGSCILISYANSNPRTMMISSKDTSITS